MPLFQTIADIDSNSDIIRRRAYGVIRVDDERFVSVQFRPYPKLVSIAEAYWAGGWGKGTYKRNRSLLYFNQPFAHRDFIVLQYMVTTLDTSWTSCAVGLSVLDKIAEIKNSNAILCELTNKKFSPRLMKRYGWEQHLHQKKRKHFIKRFYGKYPELYLHEQIAKQPRTQTANPPAVIPPLSTAEIASTPTTNQQI